MDSRTLAVVFWPAADAWAWGATGHEWISGIAIEKLPDDVPGFVRTPEAVAEIAVMGRELDRSKGAGETHDKERGPGHYVDLTDDGKVMGIVPLDKAYDTQLRAGGLDTVQGRLSPVLDRRRLAAAR